MIADINTIEAILMEAVSLHGIEETAAVEGALYESKLHKRVTGHVHPTNNPRLNGRVAATRDAGFRRDNELLVKPAVVLYQFIVQRGQPNSKSKGTNS